MQNGSFVFILIYLAFSLQGLYQSPIFYSFHLLDMIVSNFSFNPHHFLEPFPLTPKRYQKCYLKRLPTAHDRHAGSHGHLHLLRRGFYFLGWHLLWRHDPRRCPQHQGRLHLHVHDALLPVGYQLRSKRRRWCWRLFANIDSCSREYTRILL